MIDIMFDISPQLATTCAHELWYQQNLCSILPLYKITNHYATLFQLTIEQLRLDISAQLSLATLEFPARYARGLPCGLISRWNYAQPMQQLCDYHNKTMPHYFSFHTSNFALIFQHNRTPLAL